MAFAPSDLVKRLPRPLQSRLLPRTSALTLIPTLTLKLTLILPLSLSLSTAAAADWADRASSIWAGGRLYLRPSA